MLPLAPNGLAALFTMVYIPIPSIYYADATNRQAVSPFDADNDAVAVR